MRLITILCSELKRERERKHAQITELEDEKMRSLTYIDDTLDGCDVICEYLRHAFISQGTGVIILRYNFDLPNPCLDM